MSGNKGEQPVYRVADEPDAAILSRYEITPNSSGPIQKYLEAIAQLRLPSGAPLISVILFGSAAKGAFTANVSDVDLIVVLPDTASQDDRRQIQEKVLALDVRGTGNKWLYHGYTYSNWKIWNGFRTRFVTLPWTI